MAVTINGSAGVTTNSGAVYDSIQRATAVASTSGTTIDFTSIPSWVRRITVMLNGVSTNGSTDILIQLGDSGGIETTGYTSTAGFAGGANTSGSTTSTSGFILTVNATASNVFNCNVLICNVSSTNWSESFSGFYSGSVGAFGGGTKTLSDTLDRIRITTVSGTATFDAGSINILYE
jgi:hypothetical protein